MDKQTEKALRELPQPRNWRERKRIERTRAYLLRPKRKPEPPDWDEVPF